MLDLADANILHCFEKNWILRQSIDVKEQSNRSVQAAYNIERQGEGAGKKMIGIDLQNRKPIYEQVVERFETLIVNGVLEPDSQMPSVRALAMELSINPNTIQKAYSMLEQEGYIYPVKGRGNFVSGNEGLKGKKQEGIYRSIRELVNKGRELDVSCDVFVEKVKRFYREGGKSDV